MLNGLRQRARSARRILQDREIGGARDRHIGGTDSLEGSPEGVIDGHDCEPRALRAEGLGILRRQEQVGLAIVDAERQPLGTKEREQGYGDRTALDGSEQTYIECLAGIEHEGHAIAMANPQRREPGGEAAGEIGEGAVIVVLTMAVGKLDADRCALVPVAVEALMGSDSSGRDHHQTRPRDDPRRTTASRHRTS